MRGPSGGTRSATLRKAPPGGVAACALDSHYFQASWYFMNITHRPPQGQNGRAGRTAGYPHQRACITLVSHMYGFYS